MNDKNKLTDDRIQVIWDMSWTGINDWISIHKYIVNNLRLIVHVLQKNHYPLHPPQNDEGKNKPKTHRQNKTKQSNKILIFFNETSERNKTYKCYLLFRKFKWYSLILESISVRWVKLISVKCNQIAVNWYDVDFSLSLID